MGTLLKNVGLPQTQYITKTLVWVNKTPFAVL